jgi:23S rRNA (pseudouridine1915-N3)-methyltransferase
MRLVLSAVGRLRGGPLADAFADYAARLAAARWPLEVVECEERRPVAGAERAAREAALLRAAVPAGAYAIALDGRGRSLSSADFARRLGGLRDSGRDVVFLIGGADGLDPGLREDADLTLALGQMTWPHMLVRVMLAEQVYRAWSILAGHPYHRA